MTQMREKLADAKHQLDATWMEIDQMIAKVDALQESLNRSHRCWPSRLGWGVAACLAVYVIFMQSFDANERQLAEERHVIQHQNERQLAEERHANEAQERIMDRKSRAPWDGKIRF